MTLANRITVGRICLVPVFILLIMSYSRGEPLHRILAAVVFGAAGLSDGLDGFIARAYDQKTRLGAVLDPLADKLMVNTAFIFLAVSNQFETQVPLWLPVMVIFRDAFIVMGMYIVNEYFGPVRVRPRMLGKLNTVLQMAAIFAVLLELEFAWELLVAMMVTMVLSFIDYFWAGSRRARREDEP